MENKNPKQGVAFDATEYETLCTIYNQILEIQKKGTTVFEPINDLEKKPFMLKNIKDELETVIGKYCSDDVDSDRPTYYGLVESAFHNAPLAEGFEETKFAINLGDEPSFEDIT